MRIHLLQLILLLLSRQLRQPMRSFNSATASIVTRAHLAAALPFYWPMDEKREGEDKGRLKDYFTIGGQLVSSFQVIRLSCLQDEALSCDEKDQSIINYPAK